MNKKGMTLIEVIVSILILSIASVTLYTGFSKVIKNMEEGAAIKNTTNKLVSGIDGNSDADEYKDIIEKKNIQADLTLPDADEIFHVYGSIISGSLAYGDENNDSISMARFTKDIISVTENERKALNMLAEHNSFLGYGLNGDGVNYIFTELRFKNPDLFKKLTLWSGRDSNNPAAIHWYSNDVYRNLLFYYIYNPEQELGNGKGSWPELDLTNMKLKNGEKLTFKSNEHYYIQPYTYHTKTKDAVLIFASGAPLSYEGNRWASRFIFNPDDNHWYFYTGGSNYGLAGNIGSDDKDIRFTNWNNLKEKLNHEDGWVRVYE